ncbi:hypothetical protein [Cellulomonas sp. URHD0024]|uniref:hypothetical protein n=1 Tax=Cellulomonas sp. URHD0024 TaxID=1302620 RepID=UPI0012DC6A2D|nr:hypothetical protein [Cellulomonas sp. URHD0024]
MSSEASTVFVEVLTDEELAILAGPGDTVVSPFWSADDQDAETRDVVLRTAYRGLLARGIVDPPTPQARVEALGEPAVELQVRGDVQALVTLRLGARVVVAIARTTALTQDFWYAHVVEDVVLVEEVGSDGMHRFALAPVDTLTDLVVGAAVHPETRDGSGEPVELPAGSTEPSIEVAEALGAALVRADVVVRTVAGEHPQLIGLFTGPGGAWVLSEGTEGAVVVRPSTRAAVEAELGDAVRAVVARAYG